MMFFMVMDTPKVHLIWVGDIWLVIGDNIILTFKTNPSILLQLNFHGIALIPISLYL